MAGFTGRDNRMNLRPQILLNKDVRYIPPQQQYELPRDVDELPTYSREVTILPNNPDNTVILSNPIVSSVPLREEDGWNVQLREQVPCNYSQIPQALPPYNHGYIQPLHTNYPTNVEHPRLNETSQPIQSRHISSPQRPLDHQEYFENTRTRASTQRKNLCRSTCDFNMREYQFDPSMQMVNLIWKREFETHAKNIVYIDNSGNSVIMNNYPTQPDCYEAVMQLAVGDHFGQLNILGHELFETQKYFVEQLRTQQNILLYLKSPPHIPKIPFPAHFSKRASAEQNINQTGHSNETILQLQRQCDNIQEGYKELRLRSTNIIDELNADINSLKENNQHLKQESTKLDEALICKILEISELEKICNQVKKYEKENNELKEGISRINKLFNSINTNQPHGSTSDSTIKFQLSNILIGVQSCQSHNESIEKKLRNVLQLNSQASLEIHNLKQEVFSAQHKIQEQTNKLEREKINTNSSQKKNQEEIPHPLNVKIIQKEILQPLNVEIIQEEIPHPLNGEKIHEDIPQPLYVNEEMNQKETPQPFNEVIIQEEILQPLNVEIIQEEILQPPNVEIIQEEILQPLNVEKIQEEMPHPLNVEIIQEEILQPSNVEKIQEEILQPLNVEIQKEILQPLNVEIIQEEIPHPLNEEIIQEEILQPPNVEIIQEEILQPPNVEIIQKEILQPLNVEIIQEEIPHPLNEEIIQEEILQPPNVEIIQEEILQPPNVEIIQKEILQPLNVEIQKEILQPLNVEIIQEEIPHPLNVEKIHEDIPQPLNVNEEINQKETPQPFNEVINQKETPHPLNEEIIQKEIPQPLNEEMDIKEIVVDAKWTGNNEFKLNTRPIKKLKPPERFTNVNEVKPGCIAFKVKIKEIETTICKITTYSYAKPSDFIGKEVFCRPTNRGYECGILRVIFTAKVFTSTVHRNTEYAGIEFPERVGNSDGCYKGDKKQYFLAEAGYAVFLPLTDISVRF